jgi:hypothetical protein
MGQPVLASQGCQANTDTATVIHNDEGRIQVCPVTSRAACTRRSRSLRHQSGTDTGAHRVMLNSDASVDPMDHNK